MENNFLSLIKTRRSVRAYKPQPVPSEALDVYKRQAHEQGHEQGQRLSQCFHRVTSLKWPQAAHRSGCAACGWILFTF